MGLGILTEAHWQHQGQIMDSVQMALDEWLDDERPWMELQRLEPFVTHNLKDSTDYTEPGWGDFFNDLDPADGERVGAVYLDVWAQGTYIYTKNFVLGLEALESGLGWTIYHVLARALDCTIGVADHRWACDELSMRADYYADEEDEENSLTVEMYEAAHPEQLRKWEIHREFLERVHTKYRDTHDKLIWEVTMLALRLLDLCPAMTAMRTKEWFLEWDHSPLPDQGIYEHYVNTVMAWDGDDDVIRIHDDLTTGLMESGESCSVQWMFCFKIGHPRWTVRQAFEKLGWCLKMLGCIDRLAQQFNIFRAMKTDMAVAAITRIGDDENVVRLPV